MMSVNKVFSRFRKNRMKPISNETGTYYVDSNGKLLKFEPSTDNPIVDEETILRPHREYRTFHSIKNLVIPEGVVALGAEMFSGLCVKGRFVLPDTLKSIGNINWENRHEEDSCVLANCILPIVRLPKSLEMIGTFAFGHTYIDVLVATKHTLESDLKYSRQFKDGYIDELAILTSKKDAFQSAVPYRCYNNIFSRIEQADINEVKIYDITL